MKKIIEMLRQEAINSLQRSDRRATEVLVPVIMIPAKGLASSKINANSRTLFFSVASAN